MTAADRIPRPLAHQLGRICSWCRTLVVDGTWDGRDHWTVHAEWHTSPRRDGRTDGDSAVMPIPAPEPGPRDARKPAQMPRQRISSPSGPDGATEPIPTPHAR